MKKVKLVQNENGKVFLNGQEIINANDFRSAWDYSVCEIDPYTQLGKKCARIIVYWDYDEGLVEFEAHLTRNDKDQIICAGIANDTL